jgi:hypothetical protein
MSKNTEGCAAFRAIDWPVLRAEFALEVLLHNLLVVQRSLKQRQNVEAIHHTTEDIAA